MAEKRVEKEEERQKPNVREEIDGVKFHTLAKGITTHPLVRSGRPCIEGTGIMVTTIAGLRNCQNMDAQQIADHLWLELDVVHDALNYYADHKQYIDVCNELSSINGKQFAEAQYGTNPDSILYRREPFTKDSHAVVRQR